MTQLELLNNTSTWINQIQGFIKLVDDPEYIFLRLHSMRSGHYAIGEYNLHVKHNICGFNKLFVISNNKTGYYAHYWLGNIVSRYFYKDHEVDFLTKLEWKFVRN